VGSKRIRRGDCYITNTPGAGGSHHADFTLAVPVFHDNILFFWVINRFHQSDVGAPLSTTYAARAKDIFEEGLHYRAMIIQSNYEDRSDLIRMIILKNRVADRWYGDYLAQVGALRTAEKRLVELYEELGLARIREFVTEWLDYSERRLIEEIKKLPRKRRWQWSDMIQFGMWRPREYRCTQG